MLIKHQLSRIATRRAHAGLTACIRLALLILLRSVVRCAHNFTYVDALLLHFYLVMRACLMFISHCLLLLLIVPALAALC